MIQKYEILLWMGSVFFAYYFGSEITARRNVLTARIPAVKNSNGEKSSDKKFAQVPSRAAKNPRNEIPGRRKVLTGKILRGKRSSGENIDGEYSDCENSLS